MAKESGPLIEAAREANPKVTVDELLEISSAAVLKSTSTRKREGTQPSAHAPAWARFS